MDDSTKATIEKYQAKLAVLDTQSRKIKIAINGLYELESEEPPYKDIEETQGSSSRPLTIRPDQFYGRPLATVVREILNARNQREQGAISLEDLFEIMTQGGFDFEGKDEMNKRRTLAITIGKNPAFVRVPNSGHVGLSEWYPNAKSPRKGNGKDSAETVEEKTEAEPTSQTLPPGVPKVFSTEGMPE